MMIVKSPVKKKKTEVRKNRRPEAKRSFRNGNGHTPVYGKKKTAESERGKLSLPRISPWKMILGTIVLGALGVLYLSHVFATQELLNEVEQLEQQYNNARRTYDDYRLTYDRMTGPAEIYEKAQNQGFINGGPADRVINVNPE